MALSIAELLDKVVGREDVRTSINSMVSRKSAVGQILDAVGNPIRQVSSPTMAYTTLATPTFGTWDNTTPKTSQALGGDVGEVSAFTEYAIVAYPINYEDDIANFTVQFTQAMANGFAEHIDRRVLNAVGAGIIPVASGVANVKNSTTSGATSYQLRTDLVDTMGLVLADGFDPNGIIGNRAEKANVLNAVGTNGVPVFTQAPNGDVNSLIALPYASSAVTLANTVRFVLGDWTKLTVAMVQTLKFETFRAGVVNIQGTPHNLIEENMVAVRAEARMMFKVTQPNAFAYLRA